MGPLGLRGYFCHGENNKSSKDGRVVGTPSLHGEFFMAMADIHGGVGVGPATTYHYVLGMIFFKQQPFLGGQKRFPCRPPKISINQLQGGSLTSYE